MTRRFFVIVASQFDLKKPLPLHRPTVRPEARPVCRVSDQNPARQIQFYEIMINRVFCLYRIVIQNGSDVFVDGDVTRTVHKCDNVHVVGRPSFEAFDVLKEAAVNPLETFHESGRMQFSAKSEKPVENSLPLGRIAEPQDDVDQ